MSIPGGDCRSGGWSYAGLVQGMVFMLIFLVIREPCEVSDYYGVESLRANGSRTRVSCVLEGGTS